MPMSVEMNVRMTGCDMRSGGPGGPAGRSDGCLLQDIANSGGSIRSRDSGDQVVALQRELNRNGYRVPVTGSYDDRTAGAIAEFSHDNQVGGMGGALGLEADSETLSRLSSGGRSQGRCPGTMDTVSQSGRGGPNGAGFDLGDPFGAEVDSDDPSELGSDALDPIGSMRNVVGSATGIAGGVIKDVAGLFGR